MGFIQILVVFYYQNDVSESILAKLVEIFEFSWDLTRFRFRLAMNLSEELLLKASPFIIKWFYSGFFVFSLNFSNDLIFEIQERPVGCLLSKIRSS